jgi:hypothetical protein
MNMDRPPDFLPEERVRKAKEPVFVVERRGVASWIPVLTLFVGIMIGIAGVAALLIFEPSSLETILGLPFLSGTEQAFQLTEQANQQRASQSALELLGTQQALATQEAALNRNATQGADALAATRTSVSLENAQRVTQAAFQLQGTQAALYLYATQVQAASAQQQIQSEINQTATQLAVYAQATQAQLAADFFNTQTAQERFATATASAGLPVMATATPSG